MVELHVYVYTSNAHISFRPGLSLGCSPTCSSNPCMNGAVCEEHWSSYSCRCANPFSQSGPNCEFGESTVLFTIVCTFCVFHNFNILCIMLVLLFFASHMQVVLGYSILYIYSSLKSALVWIASIFPAIGCFRPIGPRDSRLKECRSYFFLVLHKW